MFTNEEFTELKKVVSESVRETMTKLNKGTTYSGDNSEPNKILNVKEAAKFLDLAIPTIYSLVCGRQIPHFKTRGRLRFNSSELTDWIKSGRRLTQNQIDCIAERFDFNKNS